MPNRVTVSLLSATHMIGDISQGAVGPLAALLAVVDHYSYASVGTLILGTTAVSSVAQPLLGHIADVMRSAWLLPAGILLGAGGLALSGVTSSYWLIFVLLSVSGLGTAAYHPVGARLINRVAPVRRGTAMSVFSVGGSLGLALGSLLLPLATSGSGLSGTLWFLAPGGVMTVGLIACVRRLNSLDTEAGQRAQRPQPRPQDDWRAFTRLAFVMIGRSVAFYGLSVFIPLYWIVRLNASHVSAGTALTVILLAGICGSVAGGRFADAIGPRRVIIVSLGLLSTSLLVMVVAPPEPVAVVMLVPLGISLYAPHSVMVATGQELIPNHLGIASGLTLGIAVSAGGLAAPLLGRVGDVYGLSWVFGVLALSVLAAMLLAITLPTLLLGQTS